MQTPARTADAPGTIRVLHVSDLHCGRPFVAAHVAAVDALLAEVRFDAIVMSGDLAQRARAGEFRQARVILDRWRAAAPLLVVPGNHDTAWWHAPFGLGDAARMYAGYRAAITDELEPTLRIPGVSIVGVNSAWGTLPPALTWYPRDWRVKGGVTATQLESARVRLAASPVGDLRLLVVHHNVVRGRLSRRWGLARPRATLDAMVALQPHVVCAGHDHEERVEMVEGPMGRMLVSTANTLSRRVRGHRPSAVNVIEADAAMVRVTAWVYTAGCFLPGGQTAAMPR